MSNEQDKILDEQGYQKFKDKCVMCGDECAGMFYKDTPRICRYCKFGLTKREDLKIKKEVQP